jgi:hypothetical protein
MNILATHMLTINTHRGLLRYNRMICGWSGAPADFQRVVDQIIMGIPGCTAYLDDLCVAGKNEDNAKELSIQLLQRLAQHGVKIIWSSANFYKNKFPMLATYYQRKAFCFFTPNLWQLRSLNLQPPILR